MDGGRKVEQEKVLLSWKGPERPFRGRTGKQFLTVPVVIAILVGLVLLIAGEWVLIAVVVAMCFAYYMWTTVVPEEVEYRITTRGLRLHGMLYEWPVLSRWWMGEKWGGMMLFVETPTTVMGRLVLPLGSADEAKIEKVMTDNLLHEMSEETGLDRAARWMAKKFPIEA